MDFTNAIRKSLGYEEVPKNNNTSRTRPQYKFSPNYPRNRRSVYEGNFEPSIPDLDNYDDVTIYPEHSLYELILIRPKSLDDINYMVDQIIERSNPLIVDLSFLEKESPSNFKLAGEKIKSMRKNNGVQSFLISQCHGRNLILIAPKNIKLIKKD